MNKLESICVFCGSSEGNDHEIIEQANALGKKLAEKEITLVYGASKRGIMGEVAKSCLDNHGKVVGAIPQFLKLKEVVHLGLTELITTENMHDRKLKMQELSDGFIALPGGFGTLEELFEITTWAQLGLHQKPIALLNTGGFFNHLIAMMEEMVRRGFLRMDNFEMVIIDDDIDRLIDKMHNFKPLPKPQWLKPERT